ncbi:MAG: CehA/McbA family metallohydrolase [Myxococcota bacterium]
MRTLIVASVSCSLVSCGKEGCLTGVDDTCVVPSPCDQVVVQCFGGESEVFVLSAGDPSPVAGPEVLASPGDLVLRNDRVVAVLDALDHPHFLAPTGGSLLDLAPRNGEDGIPNLIQATGLLPNDAFRFTEVRTIDDGPIKAVQYRGTLDGHPGSPAGGGIHVATRYEIRPCEDGIRIRTEVVNREPDPFPLHLLDAFYWGGREYLPFTPIAGFDHPAFGLTTIGDATRSIPWMVGAAQPAGAASYGVTACDRGAIDAFQSQEISAAGPPARTLPPRDYEVYERFLAIGDGPSVSGPADTLLEVRRQVTGAPWVTLSGRVRVDDGSPVGTLVRASLVVSDADGPVTHTVPAADGTYSVRVPPGAYTVDAEAFGMPAGSVTVDLSRVAAGGGATADDLVIPAVGELTLETTIDGAPDHLQVFVYPALGGGGDGVQGSLYGQIGPCAPMLGHPWGGSPACNRVLVNGSDTVTIPPGVYDLYASAGPFSTLARIEGVVVEPGTAQSVLLEVEMLPVAPAGTLSADFHVHGRASFDTAMPDLDRVRAFLAARIDVIASTDHDVVNDYAAARAAYGADQRMKLLVGLETTGHVLFPLVETTIYPKVIGHFNFWPMPYDPTGPYRGAPWDELAEPGELFGRIREAGWPDSGVIELNHPWGGVQFGRDFAWPTAIGLDLTKPLPDTYDGTGQGLFLRTPPGERYSNADYDAQEVMNGTQNAAYQQYRAIWFYLLDQGVVRAGTANSDSHVLVDNTIGTPRNLVFTDATLADWDEVLFDRAVKEGRMIGTNGPVIEVSTTADGGATVGPSVDPVVPAADGALRIHVRAAPWVPIDEVRIVVNGEVVATRTDLSTPADPFGTSGLDRFDAELPLADLLPAEGDAWIVVEAGVPLVTNGDLDCNGVPDTGDTNGDGWINWRDVTELEEKPEGDCFDTVGPLAEPPIPPAGTLGYLFERVTPGGQPTAFTNPLILDRDGGGFAGVR